MDPKFQDYIQTIKHKSLPKITEMDFMRSFNIGISFVQLLKAHNHEIWRKCVCGNEEDLRNTFVCSECGTVLFKPS